MPTSVPRHRTRGICFTQNNYTPETYAALQAFGTQHCLYMVLGKEVGDSGTAHIQGFLYFENPHVYPCKKFRDISHAAHDEMIRGSPRQASDYCKKEGDFWEHGTVPSQGARTDWDTALNDLRENGSVHAIDQQPHLLPNIRALERYHSLSQRSTHRELTVNVLIGPPGCGKTRAAYSAAPDLYSKPDGQWWDGYTGQDTILLDDFDGHIPYTTLLKYLDRYPVQLPIKGGFTPAYYTTVYITSNYPIRHWYGHEATALMRRINSTMDLSITDADQEAHVQVPTPPPQGPPPPPGPPQGS